VLLNVSSTNTGTTAPLLTEGAAAHTNALSLSPDAFLTAPAATPAAPAAEALTPAAEVLAPAATPAGPPAAPAAETLTPNSSSVLAPAASPAAPAAEVLAPTAEVLAPAAARSSASAFPSLTVSFNIPFASIVLDAGTPMLGEGSFAMVFRGRLGFDVPVAVKMLKCGGVPLNRADYRAFVNEVTASVLMRHDNIVVCHGASMDETPGVARCVRSRDGLPLPCSYRRTPLRRTGSYAIIMELCDRTLGAHLTDLPPPHLSLRQRLEALIQARNSQEARHDRFAHSCCCRWRAALHLCTPVAASTRI